MRSSKNSRRVSAEFFAQGYRVSGTYYIQKRLLADAIYDPTTNYLMLEDAYVSPISDPARISAHYAHVLFDKSNLDFVLTVNKRDGLRRDQTYGMGSYQYMIFLTVPFFEISGELHIASKTFHPRTYLSTDAGTFISLLNVTARSTFNPDISYQGSVALISRSQISFFGEQTEQ